MLSAAALYAVSMILLLTPLRFINNATYAINDPEAGFGAALSWLGVGFLQFVPIFFLVAYMSLQAGTVASGLMSGSGPSSLSMAARVLKRGLSYSAGVALSLPREPPSVAREPVWPVSEPIAGFAVSGRVLAVRGTRTVVVVMETVVVLGRLPRLLVAQVDQCPIRGWLRWGLVAGCPAVLTVRGCLPPSGPRYRPALTMETNAYLDSRVEDRLADMGNPSVGGGAKDRLREAERAHPFETRQRPDGTFEASGEREAAPAGQDPRVEQHVYQAARIASLHHVLLWDDLAHQRSSGAAEIGPAGDPGGRTIPSSGDQAAQAAAAAAAAAGDPSGGAGGRGMLQRAHDLRASVDRAFQSSDRTVAELGSDFDSRVRGAADRGRDAAVDWTRRKARDRWHDYWDPNRKNLDSWPVVGASALPLVAAHPRSLASPRAGCRMPLTGWLVLAGRIRQTDIWLSRASWPCTTIRDGLSTVRTRRLPGWRRPASFGSLTGPV